MAGNKNSGRDKNYNRRFGEWLTITLKTRGISKRELATKLGITHNQVHHYTKGTSAPTFSGFAKLARKLGTTPSEVFEQIERW